MIWNRWRRLGMMLGGIASGAVLAGVVAYLYFLRVSDSHIAEAMMRAIDLPPTAFTLEDLSGDSLAVVSTEDLAILSEAGDTIVFAPDARFRIRLASLVGEGPIVLDEVLLERPYLSLEQGPDGEFNLSQAMVVTAGGEVVRAGSEGRAIELRGIRVSRGQMRVRTPYVPDSANAATRPEDLRLVQVRGAVMRERWVRSVEARLPLVRVGGGGGWRAEVGSLTASLSDPGVEVRNLAGFARASADGAITFGVHELRTAASVVAATGTVAFGEDALRFDISASTSPLAFADLRWMVPSLPEDGTVEGDFTFARRGSGAIELQGTGVDIAVDDSRLTGYFSAELGGGRQATFGSTQFALEPLSIATIQSFGFGVDLPYHGEIRGILSSEGFDAEGGTELDLDLVATVTPDSGQVPESTLFVQGPVSVGDSLALQFSGVRIAAQPLELAALRPLVDIDPDRLRGALQGSLVVSGTATSVTVEDGSLSYQVGQAPPSVLTGIEAVAVLDPELSFEITAQADPLALATISEVFPAMPFRTARFSGPIRVLGTREEVHLDTRLTGAAGLVALRGVIATGDPWRFDLTGDIAAFHTEAVLTRAAPVDGPVTGIFSVAGTSEEFRFGLDLAQEGATDANRRFALAGSYRASLDGAPYLEVGGDVSNFNLGAVIGRPRLFPSRMTGHLDLSGGGAQPYDFDFDLRGNAGVFDVTGYFMAGDIPRYAATGTITGLDLQQLPSMQRLPSTDLRGTLRVDGQGTTLETVAGEFRFNSAGSTVGGMPLDRFDVHAVVQDGVLDVETLNAAVAGTQLTAEGRVGLNRPVSGDPLIVRAVSTNLSRLAPLASGITGLQPRLTGSFLLQGTLTGSVREPVLTAGFRGQDLRYETWRAQRLEVDADLALRQGFEEVEGTIDLQGTRLAMPGLTIESLRLAADGTQDSMMVSMDLVREPGSAIELVGAIQLEGRVPSEILLDSLTLRAGTLAWGLEAPTAIRWSEAAGLQVDNLLLRRAGGGAGSLLVHGALPRSGIADMRAEVRQLDLDLVRRLVPNSPDLAGYLDLDVLLQGPTAEPEVFVRGYGTGVRYEGVAIDSISVDARYDDRRFVAGASVWQQALRVASLEAEIPMILSINDAVPTFEALRSESLSATIQADSLPIALLTAASTEVTDGAGTVVGQLDLAGTFEDPVLSGFATVRDGAVTATALGRRYERISGHFILDEQLVLIDSLVVWSGGRGEVNGSIRVADLDRPELYLSADFDSFHAIDNDAIADLTMSGSVRLDGMMPEPVLSGSVRLQQGAIYIPSMNEQAPLEITDIEVGQVGADTAVAAAVGPSVLERTRINALDVVVEEGVWIESDEARVQIRGELAIIRSGGTMQMYGTLQAVRGTYNLAIGPLFREFEVVSGSVRFLGTPDFNPDIDITAQHDVQAGTTSRNSLSVVVRLTGTLQSPSIELSSNTRPPLPESELLSWLVFGQPSFRLNQTTGALANQLVVQEILGGFLSRQLGELGLPCDYFRLRGRPNVLTNDPLGATSVECGLQLVKDLFFTVETGVLPSLSGGGNPLLGSLLAVSLDWQVNDRMTATLAREPVQAGLGAMILTPAESRFQWSANMRGTWQFGRPAGGELPVDLQDELIQSAPLDSVAPLDQEDQPPPGDPQEEPPDGIVGTPRRED